MIVSGQAGHPGGGVFDCATSGPQSSILARFNTGIGLPTEGYSYCGLAGGKDDKSSSVGISKAHQDLGGGHSFNSGIHKQVADAIADYGVLKTSSSGSYTGQPGGGFLYDAGEAAAVSTDTLPILSGMKFIKLSFDISGSASVSGTGSSQILSFFNYQIDNGSIFTAFTADIINNGTSFARGLNGTSTQDVAGFTVLPNSLSGSGTVTSFMIELPKSTTYDLTLGLYSASYPAPLGGTASTDFSHTARLSGIQAFDGAGNPFAFGSFTGASGSIYDANGVHGAAVIGSAAPEPATWAMMIGGFGAVGIGSRRRRRKNLLLLDASMRA